MRTNIEYGTYFPGNLKWQKNGCISWKCLKRIKHDKIFYFSKSFQCTFKIRMDNISSLISEDLTQEIEDVISSNIWFLEWHVRFTMMPCKPLSMKNQLSMYYIKKIIFNYSFFRTMTCSFAQTKKKIISWYKKFRENHSCTKNFWNSLPWELSIRSFIIS